MSEIIDLIKEYWFYLPTVMAIASAVAKMTPNETDDKAVAFVLKLVDIIALSSKPTTLK